MQHLRAFVAMCATLLFVASPLAAQDYWGRGGIEINAFYGVWNGIGFDEEDFDDDLDEDEEEEEEDDLGDDED